MPLNFAPVREISARAAKCSVASIESSTNSAASVRASTLPARWRASKAVHAPPHSLRDPDGFPHEATRSVRHNPVSRTRVLNATADPENVQFVNHCIDQRDCRQNTARSNSDIDLMQPFKFGRCLKKVTRSAGAGSSAARRRGSQSKTAELHPQAWPIIPTTKSRRPNAKPFALSFAAMLSRQRSD